VTYKFVTKDPTRKSTLSVQHNCYRSTIHCLKLLGPDVFRNSEFFGISERKYTLHTSHVT